ENFVVLEGPVAGTVAVDSIQVFQNTAAKPARSGARGLRETPKSATQKSIPQVLASMASSDAKLIIRDDFERNSLDESTWTTLDDVAVIGGRVRLGKPNDQEHINTLTSRPYLL